MVGGERSWRRSVSWVLGFAMLSLSCGTGSGPEGQAASSATTTATTTAATRAEGVAAITSTTAATSTSATTTTTASQTTAAADPCHQSIPDPVEEAVAADLDGDGTQDLIWIEDQIILAQLGDGRTLRTISAPTFGRIRLGIGPRGEATWFAMNLDDELGQEVLLEVVPNNWSGVAVLDLDGCQLRYVPTGQQGEASNGNIDDDANVNVNVLPLGAWSPSCRGLCEFSLQCIEGVGFRHTWSEPAPGAEPYDEAGEILPNQPMTWETTLWVMADGQFIGQEEGSGRATVADVGQLPEVTSSVDCSGR